MVDNDIDSVYSSCTACGEDLSDKDKEYNLKKGNPHFPVCNECIDNLARDIQAE